MGCRMNAFLDEVAVILGAKPALTETDREIIETMIEIGAQPAEIAETFGYAPEQIEAVAEAPETASSSEEAPRGLMIPPNRR